LPEFKILPVMKPLWAGAAAILFLNFASPKTDALPICAAPAPFMVSTPPSVASSSSRTTVSLADSTRFDLLYDNLDLQGLALSREAYHKAILGYLTLQINGAIGNPDVLSIVDFSLPSTQKRLFILDMLNGRLLFNTFVAHGRNSGKLMATRFSNRTNSFMSSLGFYLTGDPFIGGHGYSLSLQGIEPGWNDHAFARRIIMHPAAYVSEEHIRKCGFLGRSEGCPAIPKQLDTAIIDEIKGGSCLFVYAPDKHYGKKSLLATAAS
jgi:hypothetical protein